MFTYGVNIRVDRRWWESLCTCLCFFILKPGAYVIYLQMKKEKETPTCLMKRYRNSEIPRKSLVLGMGGSDWGLLSQLVPPEPKYRVMKVRFWTSPGGLLPNSAALFPFLIWDKATPGFCSVSHWWPWPPGFPQRGGIAQSCLTLCRPVDCRPPGSSVHEIFQARILEWAVISFSRGTPQPRDGAHIFCLSCTGRRILHR